MLQVIISPAKQMRVRADAFAPRGIPPYPQKTRQAADALRAILRADGPEGLRAVWRVNDRLLAENVARLEAFADVASERDLDDPATSALLTPAVFSYSGIQYTSLAPEVMGFDELEWLERHLWIVSALYGCVRPFDAVEPYRLEMGAKLAVGGARDLYAFWGGDIAKAIVNGARAARTPDEADTTGAAVEEAPSAGDAADADDAVTVVNLASVEYAKAVLPHLDPNTRSVTCIFGEALKGGKPVQRATASKIARGSMVRWMAEHQLEDPRNLTRFDVGYRFAPELSARGGTQETLVFLRI